MFVPFFDTDRSYIKNAEVFSAKLFEKSQAIVCARDRHFFHDTYLIGKNRLVAEN